jgi:hypothetical protein
MYRTARCGTIGWLAHSIAIALAILSVAFACVGDLKSEWNWAIVALWTLGPPVYFISEYTAAGNIEGIKFEYLKHSQELASRCWAALAALLTFIYAARGGFK